jgi:hypothetical protein
MWGPATQKHVKKQKKNVIYRAIINVVFIIIIITTIIIIIIIFIKVPCRKGPQTVQHIIFDCPLLGKEMEKLISIVTRTENWPVNCNKLGTQYHKEFKEYKNNINWSDEQNKSS